MSDELPTPTPDPTGTGTQDSAAAEDKGREMPPADFDAWLATQAEDARLVVAELHEKKIAGLKSALSSERDERKAERQKLQAQLNEAIAKASGAEKAALETLQGDISAAGARADFFADAHEAGVLDLRTAWAAVREYDLHDRKGQPDLEALKAKCPYLFTPVRQPAPKVDAGSGTQQLPAAAHDFNQNLRAALKGG